MSRPKIPKLLYKYKKLDLVTINMIQEGSIFFSDPRTFNDPYEVKPHINWVDDRGLLENILLMLIKSRINEEMKNMTILTHYGMEPDETIKNRFNKFIDDYCNYCAEIRIENFKRIADEISLDEPEEYENNILSIYRNEIYTEFQQYMAKGMYCLSKIKKNMLMWAHYGDQHRGICLGYEIPKSLHTQIDKVSYSGNKVIDINDIHSMLKGDKNVRVKVNRMVWLQKAPVWKYEKEWRLMGNLNEEVTSLKLKKIIFGSRCKESVISTIQKLIINKNKIKIYKVIENTNSFKILKLK